jgi:hypothetical protein
MLNLKRQFWDKTYIFIYCETTSLMYIIILIVIRATRPIMDILIVKFNLCRF